MNNIKQQAQRLSELYTELAEKGTWFEHNNRLAKEWIKPATSPYMDSDLKYWRVAEVPVKTIDLSMMVDSDILCHFYDNAGCEDGFLGEISKDPDDKDTPYMVDTGRVYRYCEIKEDYWHHWNGGECPLPEGLIVDVIRRCCHTVTNFNYEGNDSWIYCDEIMSDFDIIAFKVIGTAEGWKH